MRTVKEIDKQIQKEHDCVVQLYAQINAYEQSMEHLKAEQQAAEKKKMNCSLIIGLMNISEFQARRKQDRNQSLLFLIKMLILLKRLQLVWEKNFTMLVL